MLLGSATLALVVSAALQGAQPVVLGVGELSCGGDIPPPACSELTAALVASLAQQREFRVVRQSDVRRAEARCDGDPECLRGVRERYVKLVSGTVSRSGGGFEVR